MGKYRLGGINLSSSTNPEELALSVKSVVLALSSLIIMGASYYGYSITDAQVQFAAGQIAMAISSIGFLFGMIRKILVVVSER